MALGAGVWLSLTVLGTILIASSLKLNLTSFANPRFQQDLKSSSIQRCDVDSGYPVLTALGQALKLSTGTWEFGTAAEALLEYYNPEISVFGKDPFPGGRLPLVDPHHVKSLQYAMQHIRTNGDTLQHDDREAWPI